MADMTPLTDILNGDPADATDVQGNFQIIETYINGTDLVRTDGTEVMTANLDMDGNTLANISGLAMNSTKITGLADGTADGDAVNYGQLTQDDSPLPLGAVAYASKTSDQTGITTITDISGLSVTWTAVSGRLYRISTFLSVYNTAGTAMGSFEVQIADSSNNRKQSIPYNDTNGTSVRSVFATGFVLETGLSGSVTRKIRLQRLTGTTTLNVQGAADYPAHIIVEDLGLA